MINKAGKQNQNHASQEQGQQRLSPLSETWPTSPVTTAIVHVATCRHPILTGWISGILLVASEPKPRPKTTHFFSNQNPKTNPKPNLESHPFSNLENHPFSRPKNHRKIHPFQPRKPFKKSLESPTKTPPQNPRKLR